MTTRWCPIRKPLDCTKLIKNSTLNIYKGFQYGVQPSSNRICWPSSRTDCYRKPTWEGSKARSQSGPRSLVNAALTKARVDNPAGFLA